MPVRRQSIELPAVGSVDQRADPKRIAPPNLAVLQDVDLSETGSVRKRRPFAAESAGNWPLSDGRRQLVLDSDFMLTERGVSGTEHDLGRQCRLDRSDLAGDVDRDYLNVHSVLGADGSLWVTWSEYQGSSVGYTVRLRRYSTDGTLLQSYPGISTGSAEYARLLAWDSGANHGVWLVFADGSSLDAQWVSTSGSYATPITIHGSGGSGSWDVCQSDHATGYAAYNAGGTTGIRTWDLTNASASSTLYDSYADTSPLLSAAWISGADNLMVASLSTANFLRLRNATTATTAVLDGVVTAGSWLAVGQYGSNVLVGFEPGGVPGNQAHLYERTTGLAAVASNQIGGVHPASKPVTVDGECYLVVYRRVEPSGGLGATPAAPPSYHLCRVVTDAFSSEVDLCPVANYAFDEADLLDVEPRIPPLLDLGDGTLAWTGTRLVSFGTFGTAVRTSYGASLWRFDFTVPANYTTANIGGLSVIGGAAPVMFDGRGVQQFGHASAPAIYSLTADTGGSLDDENSYTYVAIYEFRDAQGRVWRSAPSAPATIALGTGEDEVDVVVYTGTNRIHVTGDYQIRVALFRNTVAQPTVFRRVSDPQPATDYTALNAGWNEGVLLTINDTRADTQISTNEALYTTGDILENYPTPPLGTICEHRNRLFGIHEETGDIWATKRYVEGEGPAFSLGLIIRNPIRGEKPTALVSTESSLVVFYGNRIGRIFGDGPDNSGQAGNWSEIEFLPGDQIGTYSAKVVEAIPEGIAFMDRYSGPHLLPYGGSAAQWIGDRLELEGEFDDYVGIDYLKDRHELRFVRAGADYHAFHLKAGVWSTGLIGTDDSIDLTAVWGTDHAVGCAAAGCYVDEASETYAEVSPVVPGIRWETGWINLGSLPRVQGRFRFMDLYLIGEYVGAHNLEVQIAYDFDPSSNYTVTFDDTDLSALRPYQVRVRPNRQNVQAIKVTLIERESASAGFKLTAVRLDLGVYPRGGKPWTVQGAHR